MATYTFNLPDIGEGIAEAEIVAWHVKIGDRIEEDGRIADMMTDKATVEMESPVSGTVIKVAGAEGDVIAIGSMLVEIEIEGEGDGSDVGGAPVTETAPEPEVIEAETPKLPPVEEVASAPVAAPAPAPAPAAPKAAAALTVVDAEASA
ncbi:MAG: biotin/lipoyl-containing protein, partial [Blastomonas fulva]